LSRWVFAVSNKLELALRNVSLLLKWSLISSHPIGHSLGVRDSVTRPAATRDST
jgi:hypothetical protein